MFEKKYVSPKILTTYKVVFGCFALFFFVFSGIHMSENLSNNNPQFLQDLESKNKNIELDSIYNYTKLNDIDNQQLEGGEFPPDPENEDYLLGVGGPLLLNQESNAISRFKKLKNPKARRLYMVTRLADPKMSLKVPKKNQDGMLVFKEDGTLEENVKFSNFTRRNAPWHMIVKEDPIKKESYISFLNNVDIYGDVKANNKTLRERVQYLNEKEANDHQLGGYTIVIELSDADHLAPKLIRGYLLKTTEEDATQKYPVVHKTVAVHKAQTRLRREIEEKRLLRRRYTTKKKVYKIYNNRTSFKADHTIVDFFSEREREASEIRDNLSPSLFLFTEKYTKEDLARAEIIALDMEKRLVLEVGSEHGLNEKDLLVDFKCALAMGQLLDDVNRLKVDIRNASMDLQPTYKGGKNDGDLVFNSEVLSPHLRKLLTYNRQVKVFVEASVRIFAEQENRVALGKSLHKLLDKQKEETGYLIKRLELQGIDAEEFKID